MTSERKKKVCVCTHAEERAYEVKKTSKESEKGRQKSRKGTDLCFQSIVLALFYTCYFLHPVSIFVLHAAQLFFLLLRLISFILLFGYNLPARVQHNFAQYLNVYTLTNFVQYKTFPLQCIYLGISCLWVFFISGGRYTLQPIRTRATRVSE